MEWFILHRWRQSAPNTPDWIAIIRMVREAMKPNPELKAMMKKLKADEARISAEIEQHRKDFVKLKKEYDERFRGK